MANWKYKLKAKDLWESYKGNHITASELGKLLAQRIREAAFYQEYKNQLEEIIDNFENVDDIEDFDYVLNELYDWADQEVEPLGQWPRNAMCWVETF